MVRHLVIAAVAVVIGVAVGVFGYNSVVPFPHDVVARGKAFEPENDLWLYQNTSEVFPTRTVSRSERNQELLIATEDLAGFSYAYDGGNYTLTDLMDRTEMMGLLVLDDGQIVFEDYAKGANAGTRFATFSAVKSITSILVGAALQDGHVRSLHDLLDAYISDLKGTAYEGVTIRQALQMSSGVRFDDGQESGPGKDTLSLLRDAVILGKKRANDVSMSFPRKHAPGTVFNYSTAETQILLWLVREATGKSAAAYLEETIWRPLGMDHDASWVIDRAGPDGVEIGGALFNASLRDLARVGLLMQRDGVWNGERILPIGWVTEATVPTEPHLVSGAVHPSTGRGYGYHWWSYEGGAFMADGAFGQTIYVDPNEKLVITRTSSWKSAWDEEKDLESLAAFGDITDFLRDVEGGRE